MPDVDFIARLADAWDGRGRVTLQPPAEQVALLHLADLSEELAAFKWSDLPPPARERLVFAARKTADMAAACAWCFGVRA
jgi:hypothetical protein